jgi:hypothetical protein
MARVSTQDKTGEIEVLCRGINTLLEATMTLITSVSKGAASPSSRAKCAASRGEAPPPRRK